MKLEQEARNRLAFQTRRSSQMDLLRRGHGQLAADLLQADSSTSHSQSISRASIKLDVRISAANRLPTPHTELS